MTVTYGPTPTGFVLPTLDELIRSMADSLAQDLGFAVDSSEAAIIGQTMQIFATRAMNVWEGVAKATDQLDPEKAVGVYQDQVCSLTGTRRKLATYTLAELLAVGTAGTPIPPGTIGTNDPGDIALRTLDDVPSLPVATAWGTGQTIAIGDVRTNGGHVYVAIAAGVTAPSGPGPSSTTKFPARESDGTTTWVYVADGNGFAKISSRATVIGALTAPAFSVTRVGTPIAGLAALVNFQDATTGRDLESDEDLKQRRGAEVKGNGSAAESLRTALSDLNAVTAASVFANETDYVDADGRPAHSLEPLIEGAATDAEIAAAMLPIVAGGIATFGGHSYDITDETGVVWTMRWSTPSLVPVYNELTVYVDQSSFPSDGAVTLAGLVLAFEAVLKRGRDVDPTALVFFLGARRPDLPGFLAASVKVDAAPITGATPAMVPVVIGARQKADFDSTRISIVVVGRTP